ncbi:helix-turn-helix domain-containing protein [Paenibacillus albus]|uniref:Helix-turn-helix domain-containing protein n=1 Tax=Paenibacillus albus TaxID=2495582 RepID=A0A3S9A5G6_9BACL|nr:RodZ family helix-turn-helix domain-containing protein [Paenibacillus albus]AZN40916.1 helix-turn-helix domain-containing protein [Paenibacillus albus]
MSDLGALLRKAREQRNLSLDDIQELTKIRKRYLEAIEDGNYKVLPGSFYVRAFVKNYSEAVGLDAEEVLRLYTNEIPSSVPEQVIEPVQRPRRRTQSHTSDRLSRWGFRALMWSFLLLIAVLVYVYAIKQPSKDNVNSADQTKMTDQTNLPDTAPDKDTVKNNTDSNQTTTDNTPDSTTGGNQTDNTTTPPKDDTPPVTEPPAPTTTLVLDRTSGTVDFYTVSPAGKHTVTFNATGGVWVGIKSKNRSGKYIFQKQFTKDGGTETFEVDGPAYVNVGRADLVEVTLDGVAMADGNKANPRRMQLNMAETPAGTGTETTGTTETPATQ